MIVFTLVIGCRPRDPIDYLSKFLLDNKDKYTQKQNGANA